jgi:hypothetical protein
LINPRKLAAIDIAFLGPSLIIAEFLGGVVLSIGLGVFILARSHSYAQIGLGLYFVSLGINYAPMLIYAVAIGSRQNALSEMGDELNDKRQAMTKYRRQSVFLLVPLLVAIVAIARLKR